MTGGIFLISEQDLRALNFLHVGEIVEKGTSLEFDLSQLPSDRQTECGWVYAWVVKGNAMSKNSVVYIGKAGKTLQVRCNQHKRGFNEEKKPGRGATHHAPKIREALRKGHKVSVYGRLSPKEEVLGQRCISLHSVEEDALIKKWNPPWNKINNSETR